MAAFWRSRYERWLHRTLINEEPARPSTASWFIWLDTLGPMRQRLVLRSAGWRRVD